MNKHNTQIGKIWRGSYLNNKHILMIFNYLPSAVPCINKKFLPRKFSAFDMTFVSWCKKNATLLLIKCVNIYVCEYLIKNFSIKKSSARYINNENNKVLFTKIYIKVKNEGKKICFKKSVKFIFSLLKYWQNQRRIYNFFQILIYPTEFEFFFIKRKEN